MKLTVSKEEFEKALMKVSCALGEKNEEGITKNFGFKTESGTMTICANSQKISAEYVINEGDNLSIEDGGVAVIDGTSILSNVSNLHAGVMLSMETFEHEQKDEEDSSVGTLDISYETQNGEQWSHEHSLLSKEYFPSADLRWESKHKVVYPAGQFIDNVNKTAFAASDENYREDYTSLLVLFGEDGVVFFATDGRQMAYMKDTNIQPKTTKEALLRASSISKIAKKRILDATEDLEISIKESKKKNVTSQMRIKQGGLNIVSNLADTNRLPFEKILSIGGDLCSFSINVGTLRDGLRALSDLENKNTIWEFGPKKIVIKNSANCNRKSSGNISGVTDFSGEKCKMTFSVKYWNDILSKCDSASNIDVLIRSASAPIDLSISKTPLVCNFFIMPINDVDR